MLSFDNDARSTYYRGVKHAHDEYDDAGEVNLESRH